jgi:hypothetical protein
MWFDFVLTLLALFPLIATQSVRAEKLSNAGG